MKFSTVIPLILVTLSSNTYAMNFNNVVPDKRTEKEIQKDAHNEMSTVTIGVISGALANFIPANNIEKIVLNNLAGLGLGSLAYLFFKSSESENTGEKFGRKYLYMVGGFTAAAVLIASLKASAQQNNR